MSAASPEPLADTRRREAERVAAIVAQFLPSSLVPFFDARFTRSHLLFDEYVYRLTIRVFADAGLDRAGGDWRTAEEIVARTGLDARSSLVPVDWMLRHLVARGALARRDGPTGSRFQAVRGLPSGDAASTLTEQRAHDPACLPSYALAETAARDYPGFLRGEHSGEEILLSPTRLSLWTSYFSNDTRSWSWAAGSAAGRSRRSNGWPPPVGSAKSRCTGSRSSCRRSCGARSDCRNGSRTRAG